MDYVVIFGIGLFAGILIGSIQRNRNGIWRVVSNNVDVLHKSLPPKEDVDERPSIIQTTPDDIDALKKEMKKNDDNNVDTPLSL